MNKLSIKLQKNIDDNKSYLLTNYPTAKIKNLGLKKLSVEFLKFNQQM